MKEYLSGNNRAMKPNFIAIRNILINFTISYAKSILLTYKEDEEESHYMGNSCGDLREKEKTSDTTLLAKKQKTYAVVIVIQETAFFGTRSVVKCVNVHLNYLKSLSDNKQMCTIYLIKEIELKLPVNYVNRKIIRLTLKNNYEKIARNMRT